LRRSECALTHILLRGEKREWSHPIPTEREENELARTQTNVAAVQGSYAKHPEERK
jgi:hypothetical protein